MEKRIFSYKVNGESVFVDPLVLEDQWYKESQKVDISSILDRFSGPKFIQKFNKNDEPIDEDGNLIPGITKEMLDFAFKARDEATQELIPVLYATFKETPIQRDGSGVTQAEILDAFTDFMNFRFDLKKNTNNDLNSQSSTDGQ